MPWDRSAFVGLVGGLSGAIFRRLTWRGRRRSVGSGVGAGLRGVGSGDGCGDGMYTARCGGPPSSVRAMRFPLASTAGMVPEELCRSKRRRRPACAGCAGAQPHSFRPIPFRPVDGVLGFGGGWGAALTDSDAREAAPGASFGQRGFSNAELIASIYTPLAN